jgi:hypothetical protein
MTSVHQLLSREYGGPVARSGFLYQDHVAVRFCVDMLAGSGPEAVWCELLDDITLIWSTPAGDEPEFVQVKAIRGDRMWSIAGVVHRKQGRAGTSIVEKSLANDRCDEATRFRIVSAADVSRELRPLTTALACPDRTAASPTFAELCRRLADDLPGVCSEKGNGVTYWAERTVWDVRGPLQPLAAMTSRSLQNYLHDTYALAAPDHIQAIYDLILKTVLDAALADARTSLDAKKVRIRDLSASVLSRVIDLRHPAPSTGGTRLRHELARIGIPDLELDGIMERFVRLSLQVRQAPYLDVADRERLDDWIDVRLRTLRLQRLSGEINCGDLEFHNRCVDELRRLDESLAVSSRPGLDYLVNRMYERVNRGLHKFRTQV